MNGETQKELQMFLDMSSTEWCELIMSECIGYNDFIKVDYILQALDLYSLELYFFNKHCGRFENKLSRLYCDEELCTSLYDIDECIEWLQEYADSIKDIATKEKIVHKFDLINGGA